MQFGCIDVKQPEQNYKAARVAGVEDPYDTIGKDNNTQPYIKEGKYVIGRVSANDPDGGDRLLFTITDQTTPGAFKITPNLGELWIKDPLLARGNHLLTVRVTDKEGLWSEGVIPVFGVVEEPPPDCDSVYYVIDSVFVPGHFEADTKYFKLVPKCENATEWPN